MTHLWAVPMWLAAGPGANQPSGQGQEFGSSGPVALILIIALFIAVAFLIRSMAKHLKKVPASFDPEPDDSQEPQETQETPVDEQERQDH
ncbi:MAG TPA: hypothetical protein VGG05_01930 [Pseudonocardiaceae bacterium]